MSRLRMRMAHSEPATPIKVDWMKLLKVLGVSAGVGILMLADRSSNAHMAKLDAPKPPASWLKCGSFVALGTPLLIEGASKFLGWLGKVEVPSSYVTVQKPRLEIPSLILTSKPTISLGEGEVDRQLRDKITHPSTGSVVGKRGGGKTAFGYRILELQRVRAAPYVLGPSSLQKLLPGWIGVVQDLSQVPDNSVVLIDEAYLKFHARSSMSEAGRSIGPLVNLSRQKGLSLIFVAQESRQLDVNVISQLDWLAVKELSDISADFERPELRRFTEKARLQFESIQGDKRKWVWLHCEAPEYEGMVKNRLPSFWRPGLSKAFADMTGDLGSTSPETAMRHGTRLPRPELVRRAKSMRASGMSYGKIAIGLGISKSTAHEMVKEK